MNKFKYINILVGLAIATSALTACHGDDAPDGEPITTRRERNYLKDGNKHYDKKEYAQAEVAFRKAMAENASSDVARFDLASSLNNMPGDASKQADSMYVDIAKTASFKPAAQKSFYNLGNSAFRAEQYQESIERYKDALRRDPTDDQARENLRLAQLKLQEQQNQDQNQDQDQSQDEQEQEQQQQNKDQQDQNQNQDQNQDQDKKDDQQDKQGSQNPRDDKQQPEQQDKGGMSRSNAEQILKAMENEENATRRKVEAQQKAERARNSNRTTVEKPW